MQHVSLTYGGPMQYLNTQYSTDAQKQAFHTLLTNAAPRDARIADTDMPDQTPEFISKVELNRDYAAHISMLSFSPSGTTKPPPYKSVVKSLVDEFLTNTFITKGDPLVVFSMAETTERFWLGYIKGAARAMTALALLSIMLRAGTFDTWRMLNASLCESFTTVWIKWIVQNPDRERVAFINAALSARGSMRRANDIMTWVVKLKDIEKASQGARKSSDIISSWNQEATREAQIVGMKRTGVLNLLTLENDTLDVLISHVGDNSVDSVFFQDSTFSNKKIMPGSTWTLGADNWQLKVTNFSMWIMAQWLVNKHNTKSPNARQPLSKSQVEDGSRLCAFVANLKDNISVRFPIRSTDLDEVFIRDFVNVFNHTLELELQSELQVRSVEFKPEEHITVIKDLVHKHKDQSKVDVGAGNAVEVQAGALELAQYELMEKQLRYDTQCACVFFKAQNHATIAQYVTARRWKLERFRVAREAARDWTKSKILIVDSDKGGAAAMTEYSELFQRVKKHHNLDDSAVFSVVWANWISLGLIKVKEYQCHLSLAGSILNQAGCENIGAVAMPCHSYKENGRWCAEVQAMQNLANQSLVLDKAFVIAFEDHKDKREERPCGFPVRLITGASAPRNKMFGKEGAFRAVPAARRPCTEMASALLTKDMVEPEDMLDEPVPLTSNPETHLKAAEKWHQLGPNACSKMLSSLTTNIQSHRAFATLIVVLGDITLDMVRAWLVSMKEAPSYCMLMTQNANHAAWCQEFLEEYINGKLLAGEISFPGVIIPTETASAELLEKPPPRPQLKLAVWSEDNFAIPVELTNMWTDHSEFGEKFKALVSEIEDMINKETATQTSQVGLKRDAVKREADSPAKRIKQSDSTGLPVASSIPTTALLSTLLRNNTIR